MGSGEVAIVALSTMISLKVTFSDGLGGAARLSVAAAGWWVTWSYTWPQRSIFRFWADTVRAVLTMMASSKRDCFIRMLGLAPIGPTTDWGRGLGYYRFILFPLGLKPIGAVMGYANLVRI